MSSRPNEFHQTFFEHFRDEIHALGPAGMPSVLRAAQAERDPAIFELLVVVMADDVYVNALPSFIRWLDHTNEEVRFYSALAIDRFSNDRFGIVEMIEGGWVQHHEIAAAIPKMRAWWEREGKHTVPSERDWYKAMSKKRPYSEREKEYNLVFDDPRWVILGNDQRTTLVPEGSLPRDQGIHIVAGIAKLTTEDEPGLVAIELASDTEHVVRVAMRKDGWWSDVTEFVDWVKPNYGF